MGETATRKICRASRSALEQCEVGMKTALSGKIAAPQHGRQRTTARNQTPPRSSIFLLTRRICLMQSDALCRITHEHANNGDR